MAADRAGALQHATFCIRGDDRRQQAMLLDLDTPLQTRLIVDIGNGDGSLREDRAGVDAGVDEVDGAAGDAAAVLEGLTGAVQPGERRQDRRVHVDDAAREEILVAWLAAQQIVMRGATKKSLKALADYRYPT